MANISNLITCSNFIQIAECVVARGYRASGSLFEMPDGTFNCQIDLIKADGGMWTSYRRNGVDDARIARDMVFADLEAMETKVLPIRNAFE